MKVIYKRYLKYSSIVKNSILLLLFLGLFTTIIATFFGETYFLKGGSLEDTWIPQLAAYAIKQGMALHIDFHTPLGLFYNGLNYIALLFMESFPKVFHRMDMFMLSSILFSLLLFILFILMRINTRKNTVLSFQFLLLAFSAVFVLRHFNHVSFNGSAATWLSIYDKHMWGLLLLQIAHLFCFKPEAKEYQEIGKMDFYLFTFIQVLCAFIALNYKINFFLSSVLVAASVFFFLSKKQKWTYVFISVALFLLLLIATSVIFNYSYLGYWKDLAYVASARGNVFLHIKYLKYPLLYSVVMFLLRHGKTLQKEKNIITAYKEKRAIHVFYDYLSQYKKIVSIQFIFDFCISLGLTVGAIGDDAFPVFYVFFAVLMYSLQRLDSKKLKAVAYVVFFAWICANTLIIAKVALFKHYHPKNYIVQKLGDSSFVIEPFNPIQGVYNYLNIDTNNKETYAKLPYTKLPYQGSLLNGFFQPSYVAKQANYLLSYFSSLHLDKTDKIVAPCMMTNMLPILLKMPLYKGFYHWVHLNMTVNSRDMQLLKDDFRNADFVYARAISIIDRAFINCAFYNWNRIHKRFVITNVSQYGLIYTTPKKIKQYNLPVDPILDNSDDEIMTLCENIHIRKGEVQ